jgi:hypothetical protein
VNSLPSAVCSRSEGNTPALCTRTSTRCRRQRPAKSRIDSSSEKSRSSRSTRRPRARSPTSSSAPLPRPASRHSSTTSAPRSASPIAVARPGPALAPVTSATRPRRSTSRSPCGNGQRAARSRRGRRRRRCWRRGAHRGRGSRPLQQLAGQHRPGQERALSTGKGAMAGVLLENDASNRSMNPLDRKYWSLPSCGLSFRWGGLRCWFT